jgi:hypothetical protein
MAADSESEGRAFLSPDDMRVWLEQEIRDATKALDLRLREATTLVTAYCSGELTPAEADERYGCYFHRWGEAIPGVFVSDRHTDDQIVNAIDQAIEATNGPYRSPREIRERYSARFGKSAPRPSGPSR